MVWYWVYTDLIIDLMIQICKWIVSNYSLIFILWWRCTTISDLMINGQIRDKEIRVIGENGDQRRFIRRPTRPMTAPAIGTPMNTPSSGLSAMKARTLSKKFPIVPPKIHRIPVLRQGDAEFVLVVPQKWLCCKQRLHCRSASGRKKTGVSHESTCP